VTNEAMPRDPGARRTVGRLLGAGIVGAAIIAVIVALLQWQTRPQTDDATVRANFVGIAPQVSGHIVELHVRDNQQVQKGDPLFLIDPRPYEVALERARAARALTGKEVDGLKNGAATAVAGVSRAAAQQTASAAEVTRREMDPVVAEAEIARLEAQRLAAEGLPGPATRAKTLLAMLPPDSSFSRIWLARRCEPEGNDCGQRLTRMVRAGRPGPVRSTMLLGSSFLASRGIEATDMRPPKGSYFVPAPMRSSHGES
jgi:hypothetical protein